MQHLAAPGIRAAVRARAAIRAAFLRSNVPFVTVSCHFLFAEHTSLRIARWAFHGNALTPRELHLDEVPLLHPGLVQGAGKIHAPEVLRSVGGLKANEV